jgi:putative FmdB family regulatory protein
MPLYEYRCNDCNKVFEVLQKIDAEPLTDCLYCGGSVEKLISATSFQLKGSGWYVTDYKKSGFKAETSQTQSNQIKNDSNPSKNTGTNKNATINK